MSASLRHYDYILPGRTSVSRSSPVVIASGVIPRPPCASPRCQITRPACRTSRQQRGPGYRHRPRLPSSRCRLPAASALPGSSRRASAARPSCPGQAGSGCQEPVPSTPSLRQHRRQRTCSRGPRRALEVVSRQSIPRPPWSISPFGAEK